MFSSSSTPSIYVRSSLCASCYIKSTFAALHVFLKTKYRVCIFQHILARDVGSIAYDSRTCFRGTESQSLFPDLVKTNCLKYFTVEKMVVMAIMVSHFGFPKRQFVPSSFHCASRTMEHVTKSFQEDDKNLFVLCTKAGYDLVMQGPIINSTRPWRFGPEYKQ